MDLYILTLEKKFFIECIGVILVDKIIQVSGVQLYKTSHIFVGGARPAGPPALSHHGGE